MSNVVYLEKNDIHCTMTTFWYCHGWMMYSAQQQGKVAYINWFKNGGSVQSYHDEEKFAEEPNQFLWYFKQPMIENPPHRDGCERWTWEGWQESLPVSLMAQPLSVMKDFFKKNLIFNDETNRRGQLLVDKYNIDFENTIGITWRGTDIYLDGRPRIPIERYYKHIDKILEDNPDVRIACTSEEEGILDPLLSRYPSAFKIEEFYQSPLGGLNNPERFSPMSGYLRGLQPALMVWLFSKCAYYIKNRSSTGAVASWLSDGYIVNIGHPETLGYENKMDKDEIKGVWYDA